MGKRGPVGKPLELKVLEGNRGHRALDLTSSFRPEVGVPSIPKHLTREARKAWKRLTLELVRYNLISRVDADALAMLCQTVARVEMVERSISGRQDLLQSEGKDPSEALVDFTPKGMRMQAVMYQILNREMDKLRNLLAEFGLTPAQRARVMPGIRGQLTLLDGGNEGKPADPAAPAGFADFD